jgi:hypothetical protein
MRMRAMNQIQAAAMNEGVRRKKTLWSKTGRRQLEALSLAPWATRRRQDLLELVDRLDTTIDELTAAAEQEARKRPEVLRLVLGSPDRFGCGHQIGSYLASFPVRTPAPIVNDWGTSPNKEGLCCDAIGEVARETQHLPGRRVVRSFPRTSRRISVPIRQ